MDPYGELPPVQPGGWPANELEQVLAASVGRPEATARVVEVLARSHVWLPLPAGPTPDGVTLDLPTTELAGQPFVPVFSSEEQFRAVAGALPYAVAPVGELARGLPPGVGIAVNPEGAVGIPIPAEGVPELIRPGGPGAGPDDPAGARVGLREPGPDEEPYVFLSHASAELSALGCVLTARRALVAVEGDAEKLFVGVQLSSFQKGDQAAVGDALGRALGAAPLPWQVSLVLLDVAADPLALWMLASVPPFLDRRPPAAGLPN